MGLLDWGSPENLGLLSGLAGWAATAQKGTPFNNVGRGAVAGLTGYSTSLEQQNQLAQQKQMEELRAIQIQQAKQAQEDANALRSFDPSKFYMSPQQQAMKQYGGPTNEALSAVGNFQPKFDQQAMVQSMMASPNPLLKQKGMEMLTKTSEPLKLGKDEQLLMRNPDGSYKTVASNLVQDVKNGYLVGDGKGGWKIDPELFKAEQILKATGATRVNNTVNTPYEPQFDKEMAQLDAKSLDKYRSQAEAAKSLLSTANRLEMLNPKVYEAGGAEAKLSTANFLAGLGLNVDPKKLANSQEFEALSTKAVLDSLGGSLGAGVSNADVNFIKNTVPQLGHSVEARKQMIAFMKAKANSQIKNWNDAQNYALKNRGLKGFNPTGDMPSLVPSGQAKFLGFE